MTDAAPLSRDDLIGAMSKGAKPKAEWRIGAEHEKFGFDRTTLRRPTYEGENGILAMLTGLQRFGWSPVEEAGHVIALERRNDEGFTASISLEPGGQFELSGAPLKDVHDICDETGRHLMEVKQVADQLDLGFIGAGFDPMWRREDIPVMPKGRYGIMRAYMPKKGSLGLDMMLRTCTIQSNLDFADEADMVAKFRTSLALQPIATALFACSPFIEGKPSGFLSSRANVWTDTDPDRTGMLDFVFQDGFGFERYADYALDVPMYFAKRGETYVDLSGQSFRSFMTEGLDALPGDRATLKDWNDHLTTLFPEVRLKAYLEMRGADGGPWSR
ncbi:MAG: glutamate--cysteine ligase, partial [Brevundimonas sp.]|nr:glutamate--cysteine ligase [Brevundimonas sp.]